MEGKNWQKIPIFSKILGKPDILEKNKIFENFWIENFAIFRNSNWKIWLIYTFFNYGDTWNRLFGAFYPRYKQPTYHFKAWECKKSASIRFLSIMEQKYVY